MDALVYPRERTLGAITLVLGLLVWLLIVVGTFGLVLIYVLLGFVGYVFAQSALIAYIKNTAVRITPQQFPDLHERFVACCQKLQIDQPPEAYVLAGNGMLNAFALRFLGCHFVVLLSDTVDAMEDEPDGLNFYIGHELGHVRMKHLTGHLWRLPVLWLPLVGAAYSRAKESTCDRHGLACCAKPESAARALVALAAGSKRWRGTSAQHYARQAYDSNGFWSAFHELIGGYPWLSKRVARVIKPNATMPARNPLAVVLALFVPYGGRLGSAAGPLILVATIGILAAVALPAYQEYTHRAKVAAAWEQGRSARDALAGYLTKEKRPPESLAQAGVAAQLADGSALELDSETMTLTVSTKAGALLMVPQLDSEGRVKWYCEAGADLPRKALPNTCRAPEGR